MRARDYGKEFHDCFERAKNRFERGEDKDLKEIVQKWHNKIDELGVMHDIQG